MIQGNPRFDGLAVAKIEVDFMQTPWKVDAHAAFINSKTGETHGWTKGGVTFSEKTRSLMIQLRESMEQDLASRHFAGTSTSTTTGASTPVKADQPGGIGEFLGSASDDGTPSV